MVVDIKSYKNLWIIGITVKSGNQYTYNCTLHNEPTEAQVKLLWQEGRKHWNRVK